MGDESPFSLRTILGSKEHPAELTEMREQRQVGGSTCTQQERRFTTLLDELLTQIEQRSDTHATTDEQGMGIGR